MNEGHLSLALARLASAAKDVGTRESYNLATGIAALGMAYDVRNEDVLVQLLADCHLSGPLEAAVPLNTEELPLMMAFVQVREVAEPMRGEDPLSAMTEIGVAMLAIAYFRRETDVLNRIADAMSLTAVAFSMQAFRRLEAHRAN